MVGIIIMISLLLLVLYGLLGWGVGTLVEETDVDDKLGIDVDDYPWAFILFWPLMLIVLIVFGGYQFYQMIHDIFVGGSS